MHLRWRDNRGFMRKFYHGNYPAGIRTDDFRAAYFSHTKGKRKVNMDARTLRKHQKHWHYDECYLMVSSGRQCVQAGIDW